MLVTRWPVHHLQPSCSWWGMVHESTGLEQQACCYLCLPPASSDPQSWVGPVLSGWDQTGCWLGTVSCSPCHWLETNQSSLCECALFSSASDPVCLVEKCRLIRHYQLAPFFFFFLNHNLEILHGQLEEEMRDNWIPLLHQFNRVMEKGEEE